MSVAFYRLYPLRARLIVQCTQCTETHQYEKSLRCYICIIKVKKKPSQKFKHIDKLLEI